MEKQPRRLVKIKETDPPQPMPHRWDWARERLFLNCSHSHCSDFSIQLDNTNTIHSHRLFLVPVLSTRGSRVDDLEHKEFISLEPGTIAVLPAHRPYRFRFPAGFKQSAFHFRLETQGAIDVLTDSLAFQSYSDKSLCNQMWEALACATPQAWLKAEGLLRHCLSGLFDLQWDDIQKRVLLTSEWSTVLQRLSIAGASGPNVAGLAKSFGLSRERFSRKFRDQFHCTIREWHKRQLAVRIHEHLCRNRDSLEEVAAEFGFSDAFALSRFVKKSCGDSPREIRKQGPLGY